MICLTRDPYFTAWHLKGWNWRSLRGRDAGRRLQLFVYHTAHWCQTSWHSCTLSSVFWSLQTGASKQRDVCGIHFCGTATHLYWDQIQKSQASAFEEPGSGEINPCDLAALGEIWLESGAEVLQRAVQTGTGSAPACLSLGPSVDKTPLVKEC